MHDMGASSPLPLRLQRLGGVMPVCLQLWGGDLFICVLKMMRGFSPEVAADANANHGLEAGPVRCTRKQFDDAND